MYSLSTSWNYRHHDNGYDLVDEIKAAGFDAIELNFALTEEIVNQILSLVKNSQIKVSSLHNMCPVPKEIDPDRATPDYYSLSSPSEEERRLAVGAAKNTIRYANLLGAKAMVVHLGRIDIKDRTRDLAALIDDNRKFTALRNEMIREREEEKNGYLDNAMASLEELSSYARQMDVAIGVENRYYYREMPTIQEMEIIFKRFERGNNIYYWHDVGHAEVFERLGLVRHKDLLDKFSNRLIGVHLHDIIGTINDHRPPGSGTFDFDILRPYITKDAIKVIEVHQPASAEEIRKGTAYLRKILS